ncbi:MAG TPA: TonB-dependent receptor [Verrucomicrobiae bacterium]|nr:TonB-dependent receptor [Verrucomicrobiae bacterium]
MAAPSTHDKALRINLDAAKYGTFAEIGAGQEVARWFFRVGGATGTVAKTISAYDMAVSDALYGPTDRYVSRRRLEAMLEREGATLVEQLGPQRGERTAFFVFGDTVATRSYSRHQEGHGWLGVRFQTVARGEPSSVVIHVRLLDREPPREQAALGALGVNLLYGAFYQYETPMALIASLLDGLTRDRVEVDMIELRGPAFAGADNRLMSLQLVEQGYTDAAMFTADGEVVQPSEVLHGRPILVERGSFRPVTKLTLDLLESAREQFLEEPALHGEEPVVLMEMTLHSLASDRGVDHEDFLARADILHALGHHVLISNWDRYFSLVETLSRYTNKMMGIALGIPSLRAIADERYYGDLAGGALEAVGRLFAKAVKVYVYPTRDPSSGAIVTANSLALAPPLQHLHAFLLESHRLEPLRRYDESCLPILTPDVLRGIQTGDPAWETLVPRPIVEIIKTRRLFGCR